jgi:hypothetical protein
MKRKLNAIIFMLVLCAPCICLFAGIIYADETYISMERTICYGSCPVYRITILGNGTVIYMGERFVTVDGIRIDSISREKVKELVDAIEQADFFSLGDFTAYNITDAADAITTVLIKGRLKTVRHYYGDRAAPRSLTELESKIDAIVDSQKWTGK